MVSKVDDNIVISIYVTNAKHISTSAAAKDINGCVAYIC